MWHCQRLGFAKCNYSLNSETNVPRAVSSDSGRVASARRWLGIALCGLVAFAVLAARYSPNWVEYYRGHQEAKRAAHTAEESLAVDKAFLRGYSERGFYVVQQARNLRAEIDAPMHKIVRWRLLVPAMSHVLHLPPWATLGSAHAGACVYVLILATIGCLASLGPRRALFDGFAVAVIAGAAAPFFTSMGWLGYYDSWLAVALLTAALAPRRWMVIVACVLAPWIDERFVIGLPLALLVRWTRVADDCPPLRVWLKSETLGPVAVAGLYSIVRLSLGGTAGSQTVGEYVHAFLRSFDITASFRCRGMWEGVRFGWFFVAAAVAHGFAFTRSGDRRIGAVPLASLIVATSLLGIFTALDLSRSMVLLVPAVGYGAIVAVRAPWWTKPWWSLPLVIAALVVPASQVVGVTLVPVEHLRSAQPLAGAYNFLGLAYSEGKDVPRNGATAAYWLGKAAALGYYRAQVTLGLAYLAGDGIPMDEQQARTWFLRAAAQGSCKAQNNLGVIYTEGRGVPRDWVTAYSWFYLASQQNDEQAIANVRNLKPLLTVDQIAQGETLARNFIIAHPAANQRRDD